MPLTIRIEKKFIGTVSNGVLIINLGSWWQFVGSSVKIFKSNGLQIVSDCVKSSTIGTYFLLLQPKNCNI